jgi:predicted peptidase
MRRQRFADLPVRIEQREISVDGRGQTYGLLVPKADPPAPGYPIILTLHYASPTPGLSPYFGLGFAGQLVLPALQELNGIIVAPDAPAASWVDPLSERLVTAVVAQVKKDFRIDDKRTLVTGFSMGGTGTWYIASKHPDLFRAAVPIAAPAPDDAWLKGIAGVPLYVIHSRQDEVAPIAAVERAVETLRQQGGNVTLTPVDGLSHRETAAYVDPLAASLDWIQKTWAR